MSDEHDNARDCDDPLRAAAVYAALVRSIEGVRAERDDPTPEFTALVRAVRVLGDAGGKVEALTLYFLAAAAEDGIPFRATLDRLLVESPTARGIFLLLCGELESEAAAARAGEVARD